jgi:hypothetical protein
LGPRLPLLTRPFTSPPPPRGLAPLTMNMILCCGYVLLLKLITKFHQDRFILNLT